MTTKPNTFSLPLNHKGVFTAAMVAICWLVLCSVGQAQIVTFEGQVTSAVRELPRVANDLDGRYSIVTAPEETLVFSYIVDETYEVPIDARTSIGIPGGDVRVQIRGNRSMGSDYSGVNDPLELTPITS